jgi:hypothetical protein
MYLYFLKDSLVPLFRKDKVTLEKHPQKYKEEHNFLFFSDYRLYFCGVLLHKNETEKK